MAGSKSRSGFMSLSAELRNEIYWLAMKPDPDDEDHQDMYRWLEDGTPAIAVQSEYTDKCGYDPYCDSHWWYQPAVTKVSRQVRAEALPIYYGNIQVRAYGCYPPIDGFSAAFSRLGQIEHSDLLKHFCALFWGMSSKGEMDQNLKEKTLDEFPVPSSCIKVMVR